MLDKFLTNRPDLFDVQVMQCFVKTKHKAVLVNCDKNTSNGYKTVTPRTTIDVRVYSPVVGILLCQSICNYNWIAIVNAIDAQSDTIHAIYNDFVEIVKWSIDQIVPLHKVTMCLVYQIVPLHKVTMCLVDQIVPLHKVTMCLVDQIVPLHKVTMCHADQIVPLHKVITCLVDQIVPLHKVITCLVDQIVPLHKVITCLVDQDCTTA